MLNPFPILFLSLLAHAILRVVAGGVLCSLGLHNIARMRALQSNRLPLLLLVIVEITIGACFIAGSFTQFAALAGMGYLVLTMLFRHRASGYLAPSTTRLLLLGIFLSLFITGAGVFAVDMPF